jgi:hypothetical protein
MSGGSGVNGSSGGIGGATGSYGSGSLARQAAAVLKVESRMLISEAAEPFGL